MKNKKNKNLLPGGIVMSAQLKKLRDTNYMEFVRVYQNMVIEIKAMGSPAW
jgi:hypothetical protein